MADVAISIQNRCYNVMNRTIFQREHRTKIRLPRPVGLRDDMVVGRPGHRVGTVMLYRLCDRFGLAMDAVLGTRLDTSAVRE